MFRRPGPPREPPAAPPDFKRDAAGRVVKEWRYINWTGNWMLVPVIEAVIGRDAEGRE